MMSLLNQIFRLGKVNLVVCIKNIFIKFNSPKAGVQGGGSPLINYWVPDKGTLWAGVRGQSPLLGHLPINLLG